MAGNMDILNAKNTLYDNFFLANEVEDQYNSHLDLQQFVTIDNTLVGTAGMEKRINVYSATNGTEDLNIGVGNSRTITVTYTPEAYRIKLAQNRFEYYDEEAQIDPMIPVVGARHMGTDMYNHVQGDIYGEFSNASLSVTLSGTNYFDAFVDAVALMNFEDSDRQEVFAFVAPDDVAKIRKALKDDLKYVEAYVRTGYIGTVAGVNIYTKKDATSGTIIVATKQAVTLFNKMGVEVEQNTKNTRSEAAANTRLNTMFARKEYIVALTDARYAVKIS